MKIGGDRPSPDVSAAQSQRVDQASAEVARPGSASNAAPGDRVALSSDAALANAAVKAAVDAPDIRTDLVDRMRELLDAGELGADTDRLADSLIDRLLKP